MVLTFTSGAVHAAPQWKVAVLYPADKGGYARIYEQILSGIRSASDEAVALGEYAVNGEQELSGWLAEFAPDAIITLGRLSFRALESVGDEVAVVSGAVVLSPNDHAGISLAVDPAIFLSTLAELAPGVEHVYVVYNEKNSGWLVELADQAGESLGIQVHPYPAHDAKEAVHQYQKIFSELENGASAIWLPLDPIIPSNTVLPMLLEAAWKRDLVLFSNNPIHVRRGALFALFPDHFDTGSRLYRMALEALVEDHPPGVIPTRDARVAVNARTAAHLGIEDRIDQLPDIDFLYPAGL